MYNFYLPAKNLYTNSKKKIHGLLKKYQPFSCGAIYALYIHTQDLVGKAKKDPIFDTAQSPPFFRAMVQRNAATEILGGLAADKHGQKILIFTFLQTKPQCCSYVFIFGAKIPIFLV